MRIRIALLAPLLVLAGVLSAPADAATKVIKTTIAVPGGDLSSLYATGSVLGEKLPTPAQTCPGPGDFDGQTYRFFDLGSLVTAKSIKAYGPEPKVSQIIPVLDEVHNEYDIDISGFDAKCVEVEGPTGFTGGSTSGIELYKPKKPVRYLFVNYYTGPYNDLPVTIEINS